MLKHGIEYLHLVIPVFIIGQAFQINFVEFVADLLINLTPLVVVTLL